MSASFADAEQEKPGAKAQANKRNELHTLAVMPQRWVVECAFAWLGQSRRLRKTPNACLILACNS
jgi:transposase